MAESIKRSYSFNSALNELDPDTGKFDARKFDALLPPLRGKLMRLDGMTGCHIARYGVVIYYFSHIVSVHEVDGHVRKVIAWAAEQPQYFQLAREAGKRVTVSSDT